MPKAKTKPRKPRKTKSDRFYNPGENDDIAVVIEVKLHICFDLCAPADKDPDAVIENAINYLQTLREYSGDELAHNAGLKVKEVDRYDINTGARPRKKRV